MTTWSLKAGARVCDLIAEGTPYPELFGRKDTPTRQTLRRWIEKHSELRTMMDVAEKIRGANYIERVEAELIELKESKDTDLGYIGSKRLLIDTYLKLAAKMDPARWSDRQVVEHKSKDLIEAIFAARGRVAEPAALPAPAEAEAITVEAEVVPAPVQVTEEEPRMVTVTI